MIATFQTIISAVMLIMLSRCAYEDIRYREIKRSDVIITGCLTAAQLILIAVTGDWLNLLSHIGAGLLMFAVYFIMLMVSKGQGIGGGDVKIMVIVAAFLGWFSTILFVIIQSLTVFVYWLYTKAAKKNNIKSVPLMVYIYIAFIIVKYIFEVI